MDSVLQAGVISAPLQVLIDKFSSLAVREASIILGADEEFRKLQRTLERIRAMVGRVEGSRSFFSNTISGKAWKMWLQHVDALSYSADDLLDGISLDLAKHAANPDQLQVYDVILSPFNLTLPRQLCKIRGELDEIALEMDALYKTEFTKLGCAYECRPAYNGVTSSLVDEGSVIGRDGDKNVIVEKLLDEGLSTGRVSVVSIIGMGGIGKTTLAQLAYNDNRVVDKFDLKMWASLSMGFDTVCITKSIIESASGENCILSFLDPLQLKLQELIRDKKFLLVLDDYWSEEYRDWDILSSPFRVGAFGSKILLTSRSMIVSQIVGAVHSHFVETLSEDNSWELLKQRATSARNLTSEFERIGREIAIKCKGLPLAAKTVGGMLHFKDDPTEWISILNSEWWDLYMNGNDIFAALALSYHHLPPHLKKCFAYCAMFPKDHDFEVSELVFLWIAEGFVHPTINMGIEDLGYDYFKNLLQRSFFQSSGVNVRGGEVYKMHDLIHSMAQLVSSRTSLHLKDSQSNENLELFKNTRHLSLDCPSRQPRVLEGDRWYGNLRTLKVMSVCGGSIEVSYRLFLNLKSLRVLDLSRTGLVELPESIENLKYLRYLNLSENGGLTRLPESLANIFSLQILKLEQCPNLHELPRNMKKMVSLQYLHLDIKQLNEMPSELGKLVNLQSLSAFIVGRTEGHGVQELKNMKFLRGCLSIKKLDNVPTVDEAKQAMLLTKPFLDRLEFEWNGCGDSNHHEQILHGLQPHENLKELLLTNYNGFSLPGWFSSPLCKLLSINLQSCNYCHILTPLAKLRYLKSLTIDDMANWSQVNQDFSGFQSLEYLAMKNIPNLVSWCMFRGSRFPHLHTLHINDCQMLTNLPSLVDATRFHSLDINQCPEIRSLPHDGLPGSLAEVTISDSGLLTDRCRVQEGADWHMIRSVQKIVIDYVEIGWAERSF